MLCACLKFYFSYCCTLMNIMILIIISHFSAGFLNISMLCACCAVIIFMVCIHFAVINVILITMFVYYC
jgi:hypothetical protein